MPMRPPRTPTREDDPRHMPPNFYYNQEDLLRERQAGQAWTWSASRPHFVYDYSPERPRNIVSVILSSLIVGVLTAIGVLLCILPGLLVSIFAMFSTVAIVDRNLSPIDGIKASFAIARQNFGQVLLAWLTAAAIMLVGALLAWIMLRTRRADQQRRQALMIALVALALVVATVLGVLRF